MKNSKKSITINDIAAKLDVSKVTVSKALRNHPDISQRRVKEVKEVAAELGYIPNIAARNLSAKKTRTIGVIVPVIANSFFSSITEAVYDCAFKNNYGIILAVSQEDSSRERKHLETMLSLRVDGIMIAAVGNSQNEDLFNRIKASNIPLVFYDRTINHLKFSSVTLSNKKGAFDAVERAINKGYRKIGHIGGWQDSSIGKERYLGYKEALKMGNIKFNQDFVVFSGFGKDSGYNSFMKMYNDRNLPEFLLAVTFPVALGIYEAAKEVGIKIPDDLDLICFGDSEINDYLNPSISCVIQNTEDFAKEAFHLLLKQIESVDVFIDEHIKIGTELLIRETCI